MKLFYNVNNVIKKYAYYVMDVGKILANIVKRIFVRFVIKRKKIFVNNESIMIIMIDGKVAVDKLVINV